MTFYKPSIHFLCYNSFVEEKNYRTCISSPYNWKPGKKGVYIFGYKSLSFQSLQRPGKAVPKKKRDPVAIDLIGRFVNLLNFDGKKTRALRILENAAILFNENLHKIKLSIPSSKPKPKNPPFPVLRNNPAKGPKKPFKPFFRATGTKPTPPKGPKVVHAKHVAGTKVVHTKHVASSRFYTQPEKSKFRKPFPFQSREFSKISRLKKKKKKFVKKFISRKPSLIKQASKYNKMFSIFPRALYTRMFFDLYRYKFLADPQGKTQKGDSLQRWVQKPYGYRSGYISTTSLKPFPYLSISALYRNKRRRFYKKAFFIKKKTRKFRASKIRWYGNPSGKFKPWATHTPAQKNKIFVALYRAISNVKPPLECRSKRFGGSNRLVPGAVSNKRQVGYAIRWIIEDAKKEMKRKPPGFFQNFYKKSSWVKNTPLQGKRQMQFKIHRKSVFCFCLAEALKNAYIKRGSAMQKRNLWIETANANKAFFAFRWW